MDYSCILPDVLKREVERNPKGYASRLRLSCKRTLKWIVDHTQNLREDATTGERTYWVIHHLDSCPLCKECHQKPAKFYNVIKGYGSFCSLKCVGKNEEKIKKSLCTSISHYGKDNINNREKAKQTCKKLYGKEYYMETSSFKESLKKFLDENGVRNTSQIPEICEKAICTRRRKHGNSFEKIVEKQKKTISSYSNEKKQCIKDKRKATCRMTYGVDFSFQDEGVKEKVRKTHRKNYGVDYPMQSNDFRKNIIGKKYAYDGKSFDSSDEIVLYIWLKDHHIAFNYQPGIKFEYAYEGEKKWYFPDFQVGRHFFEVKGNHFFKEDGTMQNPYDHSQDALYEAKHQCMLKNHVVIIPTRSLFMKRIKRYIREQYGKNFLQQLKVKRHKI